ncbi:MAG: DUF4433 domain-containing protein [Hahellaceae bacterium]|nr:DUF4433 domain-containing protein [Hahellaceae bacterium]
MPILTWLLPAFVLIQLASPWIYWWIASSSPRVASIANIPEVGMQFIFSVLLLTALLIPLSISFAVRFFIVRRRLHLLISWIILFLLFMLPVSVISAFKGGEAPSYTTLVFIIAAFKIMRLKNITIINRVDINKSIEILEIERRTSPEANYSNFCTSLTEELLEKQKIEDHKAEKDTYQSSNALTKLLEDLEVEEYKPSANSYISDDNLKKLLSDLGVEEYKPTNKTSNNDNNVFRFNKRNEIKTFSNERNIKQLIHFTRYENLESILLNGLVTRNELDELSNDFYTNDILRLDGRKNSISLSISFPNYKMFYKYRMISKAKGWIVLFLSPEVLWHYNCLFCMHNAADLRISTRSIASLSGVDSFKEMFFDEPTNTRLMQRLEEFYTTDPQAEVLVLDNVPLNYILSIGFDNLNLLNEAKISYSKQLTKHINLTMATKYFDMRGRIE